MGTKPYACQALMGLAVLILPALASDPTRPGETKPRILDLVQQLGSDTYAGRNEASRQLEVIGAPALADLRQALASTDLEIRRRAKRLINRIELALFHEVRQFRGHHGSVNAVAFSPDSKRAASCDSAAVRLWDIATGKEIALNEGHRDRVMTVAFSPDGKYVASGSEDHKVMLLDAAKLTEIKLLGEHRADVRSVVFSRDGKRLITTDVEGAVIVWSVPAGKVLARLRKVGADRVFAAALLDDRRLILAPGKGNEPILRTLDEKDITFLELPGHSLPVMSVAVSADGKRMVTASHDQLVVSWDMKKGKPIHRLRGHTAAACSVAISADGRYAVSGGADKDLRLWDLAAGRAIRGLRGHTNTIWSVAISANGKYALSGSADGTMRLWTMLP